jgi:16S rRNA (adenine1518-N6/adenine1519-N6)-dimethyltransferase
MTITEILKILAQYNLKPKKLLGQNFLIDQNILNKIVKAAELTPTDNVLEVGAGLGVLTKQLIARVNQVLAVELDKSLFFVLKQELRKAKNLKLVNADILKIKIAELEEYFAQKPYKVVANIPYNITSNFLRKFLELEYQPNQLVLLIQKEVAQRIVAKPGQMSILSVSVQYYSEPKIIDYVSKNCFFPKPTVESAIIKLKVKDKAELEPKDEKRFFQLVKIGFSAKRKQLQNNLANGLHISRDQVKVALKKAGLKETARAQELALDDWNTLVGLLF